MKVYHLSAVVWLFHTSTMAQRFRAMDTLPEQTLAPRYYQAASPLPVLGRRQIAACEGGQHPCGGDIGALGTGFCCPDDTYCIVDPLTANKPACCAIGSVCGSSCSESQYQCIGTTTINSVTPASTSTFPACCPRQCITTSQFGCPSSLGGGCCSYGQTCASNSQCFWTSTSSTAITIVSQLPPGCTTSQIGCPSSMGGGCCAVTQSCTFASGSPACAAITTTPTGSGISPVSQDTSLGTAAKAGIAIGVILAAGLLIGILTYLYLRRRRRRLASQIPPFTPSQLASPYSRTPTNGTEPTSPIRRPRRTAFGLRSPVRGPEMNETNSDVVSHGGRLRGLTADYFGPDAVPGPFTETDTLAGSGVADSPGGRNPDRAVPMSPLSPDDITAPVEIDSRKRQISETIEGRHELYGSGGGHGGVSPWTPSPGTGGVPFSPVVGTGTYSPGTEVPPYSPGAGTMDSTMSYVPGTDTLQYSPMRQEKDG